MTSALRRYLAPISTLTVVLAVYVAVRPTNAAGTAARLASKFRFQITALAEPSSAAPLRRVRDVNPAFRHIDAWISSVGAGAALADVDGDGLPNDLCLVDPRNDSVTLRRIPEGQVDTAFALVWPSDGYDARTIAPMGCLLGDVNEDGATDVVVYFWGRTPVALIRKPASILAAAAFIAVDLVPARERWFTNAGVFADVDGDGHQDLLFGNYFRDGDRVLDPSATDGASMQHSMSRAFNSGRARLLLWERASPQDIRYTDASDALPEKTRHGWMLALGARDLDGDLLPEIYFANDFGPDRLLHNRSEPGRPRFVAVEGRRDFTTPRSKVLGQDSFKGMGVDFADVNADGRPDLAVSNISRRFALVESHYLFVNTGASSYGSGVAPFEDEGGERGTWIGCWGWDLKFADFDNDGSPELLQACGFIKGERNRWPELQELATANDELLRHPRAWPRFSAGDDLSGADADLLFTPDGGRFHDVGAAVGFEKGTVSRGVAIADVDGDGRVDAVIARQWMSSILLHNLSPTANQSLVLDLRVPCGTTTCPAIGARVVASLPSGESVAYVDGGSGHSGKRAPEVHVGLGGVRTPIPIRISWRDAAGVHEMSRSLPAGRHRQVLREVK